MKIFKDILHLFFPKICFTCNNNLVDNEKIICTSCYLDLPLVDNKDFINNDITNSLLGKIEIKKGGALLYLRSKGKTKELIHHLKYKNQQEIGTYLGKWFGSTLNKKDVFSDVDYIIPVPLHKKKQRKRGYNQLTYFGKELSDKLEIKFLEENLVRINHTETQTYKNRIDRFRTQKTKFLVTDPYQLKNKHILLIDDVITTGATLKNCCDSLTKVENCKISILTMAYTE